jgi:hypothetical protein
MPDKKIRKSLSCYGLFLWEGIVHNTYCAERYHCVSDFRECDNKDEEAYTWCHVDARSPVNTWKSGTYHLT